jgi:hypothetical protein
MFKARWYVILDHPIDIGETEGMKLKATVLDGERVPFLLV